MSPTRQSSTERSTGSRSGATGAAVAAGAARRSRPPVVDAACAEAVELARAAAEETAAPAEVGEHLGLRAEAERVVTHYFACLDPGYRGWRWAVTVARASRARNVTVDECVLLPGDDALLAPAWVPWLERLRPGDIGPGDLMPTAPDDPRLAPGYTETSDAEERQVQWELGLGRPRVLSAEGRDEAAERWYDGVAGPRAPIATSAPAQCATCGFYVPLAGGLRQVFGVCANEYAPDDGRVVSADHGCGAHSDAITLPAASEHGPPVLDELDFEIVSTGADENHAEAEAVPAVAEPVEAGELEDAASETAAPRKRARQPRATAKSKAAAAAEAAEDDDVKAAAPKTRAPRKARSTAKSEESADAAGDTGTKPKATRTRARRATAAEGDAPAAKARTRKRAAAKPADAEPVEDGGDG